jgi:hypothetical protein
VRRKAVGRGKQNDRMGNDVMTLREALDWIIFRRVILLWGCVTALRLLRF